MNSSKAPDDIPDSLRYRSDLHHLGLHQKVSTAGRTYRLLAVLGLAVLSIPLYWGYLKFQEYQGKTQLVAARQLLDELLFEPAGPAWNAKANRVETLLKSVAASSNKPSANILLATLRGQPGFRPVVQDVLSTNGVNCNSADIAISALLLLRGGELSLADKLATLALKRGDEPARALRAATIIDYQLGRDEGVVNHATAWSKIAPDEVLPWQYLAYVAEDRGFWSDAIIALRKQIALMSGNSSPERRRLVTHLIKVGDVAESRREFIILSTSVPLEPKDSLSLLEAKLLFLEGNLAEAERILLEARYSPAERVDAIVLQSTILLDRSETDKAIPLLRECVKDAPANQDAHYLLGQALSRTGHLDEARSQMETHRKLLDLKVRINSLERQAGHEPANVEVRQTLSQLYNQIGLTEQAKLWQDAANTAQQSRSR